MDVSEAGRLGRRLLDEHGLHDWTIAFDRAKRRAGVCRPGRRQIGLSAPLTSIHPEREVRDTILHEIAHALVGTQHGHDDVWRAMASRIGCSGERCSSEDAPSIDGDWVGTCPAGHRRTRHRRPERPSSCTTCAPGFDVTHLLSWTYRGQAAPMLPGYRAELERITRSVPVREQAGPGGAGGPGADRRAGTQVRRRRRHADQARADPLPPAGRWLGPHRALLDGRARLRLTGCARCPQIAEPLWRRRCRAASVGACRNLEDVDRARLASTPRAGVGPGGHRPWQSSRRSSRSCRRATRPRLVATRPRSRHAPTASTASASGAHASPHEPEP